MSKVKAFKVADKVQWKWLGRAILGEVKEVHSNSISKEIKGKKIKRNGSEENPAYLVQSEAGNEALKLHSELQQAKPAATQRSKSLPKMFK